MPTRHRFQLHMITDGMKQAEELRATVEKALRGGADAIQLRYKSAPALDIFTLGSFLKPITDKFGARLLINDRLDVALALPGSGVHLAGKSLPVNTARAVAGPAMLLGCSVHSVEEAKRAEDLGASYVTFGHIFRLHPSREFLPAGRKAYRKLLMPSPFRCWQSVELRSRTLNKCWLLDVPGSQ